MNKTFNKIIVSGVSLLMLAGVGASASQVSNPVHASRISRLRARRNRDYRDIKSINAQLDKLEHKTTRHAKNHAKKPSHHESLAEWYKHNAKRMKWHEMINKSFHEGYDDGSDSYDSDSSMYPSHNYMSNEYKRGWVIGYANNSDMGRHGSLKAYKNGLHYYADGTAFIKESQTSDDIALNNGEWGTTD